ncbi:hypothetical protein POJ06DRAFT_73083 [Lipomyces tetrasporus]|uniref:Uncharacterized protein n=1 Tax=Lipomyces tetrasporus TaxID=54092 RepID=A0AAD7QUT7_9ASCO|nr:uncharacterized protein POJ06DRAFT_73083 [Lipomyces tetrasporus]KAJ8101908.1 hypothetical protein POJ06DRAFT_73083 [Lipomyces tetrasporus]
MPTPSVEYLSFLTAFVASPSPALPTHFSAAKSRDRREASPREYLHSDPPREPVPDLMYESDSREDDDYDYRGPQTPPPGIPLDVDFVDLRTMRRIIQLMHCTSLRVGGKLQEMKEMPVLSPIVWKIWRLAYAVLLAQKKYDGYTDLMKIAAQLKYRDGLDELTEQVGLMARLLDEARMEYDICQAEYAARYNLRLPADLRL